MVLLRPCHGVCRSAGPLRKGLLPVRARFWPSAPRADTSRKPLPDQQLVPMGRRLSQGRLVKRTLPCGSPGGAPCPSLGARADPGRPGRPGKNSCEGGSTSSIALGAGTSSRSPSLCCTTTWHDNSWCSSTRSKPSTMGSSRGLMTMGATPASSTGSAQESQRGRRRPLLHEESAHGLRHGRAGSIRLVPGTAL